MKRSHKKPIKKNLFDDENENEQTQQQNQAPIVNESPEGKKLIGKTGQRYDAHKIEQNQLFIGREQKEEDLMAQNKKTNNENSKGNKRNLNVKKKKKNLFQSDEEDKLKEQQQDQIKEEKQQSKAIEINKTEIKQQKVTVFAPQQKNKEQKKEEISQDNSQQQQIEEGQEEAAQKMKQMLSSVKVQDKKIKQISFSRLLEEAGQNREQIKRLLYEPIPKGYRATCIFKRSTNAISQSYSLITQDDQTSLIFCQNQRGSIGANYYFSLTKQMDKNSVSYLGKLRGNSTGSVYQLFDAGKQPEKSINRKEWRTFLGRIQYQTNLLGMNGPRKLRVIIPNVKNMEQFDSFKLAQNEQITSLPPTLAIKYRNKQPRWNQRLKSYALNFGGRVKQASIKNFILVNDEVSSEQEFSATNTLVFGKMDDNSFSLEAIHPLSLFQAFGIVMSEFDFKLNCQ